MTDEDFCLIRPGEKFHNGVGVVIAELVHRRVDKEHLWATAEQDHQASLEIEDFTYTARVKWDDGTESLLDLPETWQHLDPFDNACVIPKCRDFAISISHQEIVDANVGVWPTDSVGSWELKDQLCRQCFEAYKVGYQHGHKDGYG